MKIDEFLKLQDKKRKKPKHEESGTQQACVRWFRLEYPRCLIFSVPNGGSRNAIEAANLKKEGALAGASDLICVADHKVLFVEMKSKKGRQRETQKEFQRRVEILGFKYVVCRSLDDFMQKIKEWHG